jgi:hypothetical protein
MKIGDDPEAKHHNVDVNEMHAAGKSSNRVSDKLLS